MTDSSLATPTLAMQRERKSKLRISAVISVTPLARSPERRQRRGRPTLSTHRTPARLVIVVNPKQVPVRDLKELLAHVRNERGDRACLEGNNQKQADFSARALTSPGSEIIP